MINFLELEQVKISYAIPTFLEVTHGYGIILELTNRELLIAANDDGMEIIEQFPNFEKFFKDRLDEEDFEEMYWIDLDLTNEVKKTMPEVKAIYLCNL